MASTISKSVGRAFEILESFRDSQEPATASDLTRRLKYPHSSGVAVLKILVQLGYLNYDRIKKAYFPTQRVHKMGVWVQSALIGSSGLLDVGQAISRTTGETTAITSRSFIFNHILNVFKPERPLALGLPTGVGITLCNSVVGRVILSQMSDIDVDRILRFTKFWAKNQKTEPIAAPDDVWKSIKFARDQGYLVGYDVWLPGVGAIAYPLKAPFDGYPLALAVTGPSARIKKSEPHIRRTIEKCLKLAAQ